MGVETVKRTRTTALLTILIFVFITGQVWAHNPAAVRISDGLSLGLFVNASGELNSFGYRLLGFLNKHWSDDERLAVADSIGTDGLHLKIQADPYVFVQYNNFRVQGGGKAEGWAMVPKELAELAFRGITIEQIESGELKYDFSDIQGQGGAYAYGGLTAVFSVADYLGLDVEDIKIGVSGRYLHGLAYGETDFHGTLEYFEEDNQARIVSSDLDLTAYYARQGRGWAVDAGVYAQVTPRLAVDVSVANIGQVIWTDVSGKRYARPGEWELIRFGFDPDNFEFDFEFADGEELQEEDLSDLDDITWKLPLRIQLGAQYEFDEQVTLRGSVRQIRFGDGLTDFGVGGQVEYRPVRFVPLTLGADYSTSQSFTMDGGVGLRFDSFTMQFIAKNLQSLFLTSGRGLGFSFTVGLEF